MSLRPPLKSTCHFVVGQMGWTPSQTGNLKEGPCERKQITWNFPFRCHDCFGRVLCWFAGCVSLFSGRYHFTWLAFRKRALPVAIPQFEVLGMMGPFRIPEMAHFPSNQNNQLRFLLLIVFPCKSIANKHSCLLMFLISLVMGNFGV